MKELTITLTKSELEQTQHAVRRLFQQNQAYIKTWKGKRSCLFEQTQNLGFATILSKFGEALRPDADEQIQNIINFYIKTRQEHLNEFLIFMEGNDRIVLHDEANMMHQMFGVPLCMKGGLSYARHNLSNWQILQKLEASYGGKWSIYQTPRHPSFDVLQEADMFMNK